MAYRRRADAIEILFVERGARDWEWLLEEDRQGTSVSSSASDRLPRSTRRCHGVAVAGLLHGSPRVLANAEVN